MRGHNEQQSSMLALMSPEAMVPSRHPLRKIKRFADEALKSMSGDFDEIYSESGRPSIPPERLLKSMILMALYSVRSERMFCEQLGYNLLFRWFLDMDMVSPPFDATTFTKNRDRLLDNDIAGLFFEAVISKAKKKGLTSSEHFSVDGTLIEAWASHKSFRPKDEDDDDNDHNGWSDFSGKKRSNDTHESKTDPEAKLARKGNSRDAKLSYSLHALIENRNGLVVNLRTEQATGRAERDMALLMVQESVPSGGRATLGADAGYDTQDFVEGCRARGVTPHVAQNQSNRRSRIDGRTTGYTGYHVSQIKRRLTEGVFGWLKTYGGMRRTRYRGVVHNQHFAYIGGTAYNLLRMAKLFPEPA